MPTEGEKLHKVLAQAGLASRREIERWIEAGRVSVNGRRAEVGMRVGAADVVRVDGERITLAGAQRTRVLAYHKPVGELCTRRDPEGRPTVFDHLPLLGTGRWLSIGRLDVNTAGLLLFTDDGALAHRLMHPSTGIEREYAVRVLGEVARDVPRRLREGVELDDGPARFESVVEAGGEGANRWYHVTLREGRKREVRRLWESQGLKVSRLIRVRFGPVRLERALRPGRWEALSEPAIAALRALAGLPPPPQAPPAQRARRPRRVPPRRRR